MGPKRTGRPRRARRLAAAIVTLVAVAVPAPAAQAAACLRPPVAAPISRGFDAPPCRWCAGHRGVRYAVVPGSVVRAAAAGTVTFSGVVVDVRYVVVRHADGLLATYGGLRSSPLRVGEVVALGAVVGSSGPELYFGLRTRPDEYIDPEPLLGELVVPPYLVPTDGTPGRPPPDPVLRCS
jgi:murein DD-endopeptidase MepM/ murein hydrolase activator NlpD